MRTAVRHCLRIMPDDMIMSRGYRRQDHCKSFTVMHLDVTPRRMAMCDADLSGRSLRTQKQETGGQCGWPSAIMPSCTGSMLLSTSLATRSAHMARQPYTVHPKQSCRQVTLPVPLCADETCASSAEIDQHCRYTLTSRPLL